MKISELKGKKIVHICVILGIIVLILIICLLYTSPSPRD